MNIVQRATTSQSSSPDFDRWSALLARGTMLYILLISAIGLLAQSTVGLGLMRAQDLHRLPFPVPHWLMILLHHWAFIVALGATLYTAVVERKRRVRFAILCLALALPAVLASAVLMRTGRNLAVIMPISQFVVGAALGCGLALAFGQGKKFWIYLFVGLGLSVSFILADKLYTLFSRVDFFRRELLTAVAHAAFGLFQGLVISTVMSVLQKETFARTRATSSLRLERHEAARAE